MLRIEERELPEGLVLGLAGTVDMYSSPDLKTRLDTWTDGRLRRLVVDLASVDFIDSSGLAALVSAQRRMRRTGGRLQLAALTPRVHDVLALMQLLTIFEIHGTVQDALSA
jgi:anti-sigma B factor antagonist